MICDSTCSYCIDKPYLCSACANYAFYPDETTGKCNNLRNFIEHCVKHDQIQFVDASGTTQMQYVCTRCSGGYFRILDPNALGYRYICQKCESTDGETNCKSCGMRYVSETIYSAAEYFCEACNAGFFLSPTTNHCNACSANCATCVSPQRCSKCDYGFFLHTQGNVLECRACAQHCASCIAAEACTVCEENYHIVTVSMRQTCEPNDLPHCLVYKADGNCEQCEQGYYVASGRCASCAVDENAQQSHCNRCYGIQNDELTGGHDYLQCADCQPGYYLSELYKCVECNEENHSHFCVEKLVNNKPVRAKQCALVDVDTGACLQCPLDYFLTTDGMCRMCPSRNPAGCVCAANANCTSPQLTTIKHCSYCGTDCACGACDPGYILTNGICIFECLGGVNYENECFMCGADEFLYVNTSDPENVVASCQPKIPKCLVQKELGICQECEMETTRLGTCEYQAEISGVCMPEYYMKDGWCKPCSATRGCVLCSSGTECAQCVDGSANPVCSIEHCRYPEFPCTLCEIGYFLTESGMKCADCKFITQELIVDGQPNPYIDAYAGASCSCGLNCSACSADGHCSACKTGNFLTSEGFCDKCNFFCTECSSLDRCYGCIDGFFLDRFDQCQRCFPGCAKCQAEDTCSQCEDGYYLKSYANYEADIGRGRFVTKCEKCTDGVTICQDGGAGYNGVVDLQCAAGWYLSGFECVRCPEFCITCSNQHFCTQCIFQSIRADITQGTLDTLLKKLEAERPGQDFTNEIPSLEKLLETGNVQCTPCREHYIRVFEHDPRTGGSVQKCVCWEYYQMFFGTCVSVVYLTFISLTAVFIFVPLIVYLVVMIARDAARRRPK